MRNHSIMAVGLTLVISATVSASAGAAQSVGGTCAPPGAWSARSDFPSTIVRSWGAFFPPNGKFYVLGGRYGEDSGQDLLQPVEYDPALDAWTTKSATFEDGQVNNMVGGVLDVDGTPSIILVGGSAAAAMTATADVRLYDPIADVITVLTDDPWPGDTDGAELPGGAAVIDNKLYVFGGYHIANSMLDSIDRFDPAAAPGSRWTRMTATLPVPLGYIPTAASGGLVYLLGGSLFVTPTIVDSTDASAYDPVADVITTIASNPRAAAETRAVAQPDGSIWVLGGGRVDPNPGSEVDVYTPGTDTWSLGPPMITARRNFPADVDPASGTVWATGGYDFIVAALSVNEQFTPCAIVDDTIFVDGFDGN